jgi:hypothetical protein
MNPDSKPVDESSNSCVSGQPNGQNTPHPTSSDPAGAGASAELTKEEQWALFEKELKESDWGHQPC